MAPEQSCFCGRLVYQPRCGSGYDPVDGIKSCGAVCGEMLSCGRHSCEQPCHAGLCRPCPREEKQPCYCGRHTRTARCGDGRPQQTHTAAGPTTGHYSCGSVCGQPLACGEHTCQRPCHAHAGPSAAHGDCPLDPAAASTCHCGKQQASALGRGRTRCTDPVPSCGDPCGRVSAGCSHPCQEPCHAGPCPPCTVRIDTLCACGATRAQVECRAARSSDDRPRCERLCAKKRACRRHQCAVRCCPSDHVDVDGVVVPSERLAPGETDPHHCTLVCGRQLRCKAHRCEEPCHRGACPPCRAVGMDVLSCACGRTQLFPPIPCGTALPPCRHSCPRPRQCGHISLTPHECHPDTVPCPPCPVLVATDCMCGAKEMKNVPCHRSSLASCGAICNRLLPCGGHRCPRSCHRPDDPCLRGQPCRQPCGKPRKACGHPCVLACHSPAMCDESRPCEALVDQTCPC
ncbi:FKBP12-associated protein, partial [Coemansia nantahalensis]